MHRTLKKLYRDHAHFNQLMDILDQHLENLDHTGSSSSTLLQELIAYVADYVDTIHHPIEDQLYEFTLARTDNGREHMERLLGDHQIIMNMTREFSKALAAVDENENDSWKEVLATGRDLVKQQRDHMQFEEQTAFPILRKELGSEDFDNAAMALPADEDPLLDTNMQGRYPELFKYMQQEK